VNPLPARHCTPTIRIDALVRLSRTCAALTVAIPYGRPDSPGKPVEREICRGAGGGDRTGTRTFTLTSEQRDTFKRAGILRLDDVLWADGLRRAREVVLQAPERVGFGRPGLATSTLSPDRNGQTRD
jgi:hypothetical protein